jgi:chemotaxis protein CheX
MSTGAIETSAELQRWGELLESATHEVFGMMLGCEVKSVTPPDKAAADVTAIVGLAGQLCGALTVRCSLGAAQVTAATMLGMSPEEVSEQQWDAVGEICNMVAGNFKSKLNGLGDRCMLSVPTLVNGTDYTVRSLANGKTIYRAFEFKGELISMCLEVHG